jgi:hypothetical protein
LKQERLFFPLLFAALLAARLCHTGILWEGDAYPLAAAGQMLFGKALYSGIWFDKPPVLPLFYLLSGARPGWALRVEDALYALVCCAVAYGFARDLWTRREGLWAAGLMAFYQIFYLPSAAIPVASDLLMLAPNVAAVWMAYRRRPLWSGALAALAFWISPKGVFVAAACALWYPAGIPLMAAGWAAVSAAAAACLWSCGALAPYWREVWQWGMFYLGAPLPDPVRNGLLRTLNWMGFHAAACVAAGWFLIRGTQTLPDVCGSDAGSEPRLSRSGLLWWVGWILISAVGVAAGMRFFPRYYFLLLPAVVLMAARGFTIMGRCGICVAALLLIPLVRFGPTYVTAATGAPWRDTALDRDGRQAAALIRAASQPGDTLFVWGYRPEIYAYAGLPAASVFLDSQPLTGISADRYLTPTGPMEQGEDPRWNREELAGVRPTFIAVETVPAGNGSLEIAHYPDLRAWFAPYREVAHTRNTVIFRRQSR